MGQLGRLAPYRPRGMRSLVGNLPWLPTPPPQVSYYAKVPSWPMFGNDRYADCTCAAAGHLVEAWSAEMAVPETVTDTGVLDLYRRVNHGQDAGAVIYEVLCEWQSEGLSLANGTRHKIAAFAPVHRRHNQALQAAIWLFGGADLGIMVTESARQQFEATQPWTVVDRWERVIGRHSVSVVGYDPQWLYVVTWGHLQAMSWQWWQTYGEEAWAAMAPEFMRLKKGPTGADLKVLKLGLEAFLRDNGQSMVLTGRPRRR